MNIAAIFENGAIKLPPAFTLPEGTRVQIVVPLEPEPAAAPESGAGEDDPKWMLQFAGCIDGLPEDLSDEHDHYLYGTPKHSGQ